MRSLALFAVLFAVYAAGATVDSAPGERYAGDEPHVLLAAESLASDGDLDLSDDYRTRAYRGWYGGRLRTDGVMMAGRLREPRGAGLPALVAPAYRIGGPRAVGLWLAAIFALAFVLAAAVARRLVPEPWASSGVALVGLSPPAVAYATAVTAEPAAAFALTGAVLCAATARERYRNSIVAAGALALASLPWLGPAYVLSGLPVALALVRATLAARHRLAALLAGEAVLGSLVLWASVNELLFGRPLPAGAAGGVTRYTDRVPRLAGVWLDRGYGLLPWTPALLLAGVAAWRLYRSRRRHLARLSAAHAGAQACAALALVVCATLGAVAALGPRLLEGPWAPGRVVAAGLPLLGALAAWGLRFVPRAAGAALAGLTLGATGWALTSGRPWSALGGLDLVPRYPAGALTPGGAALAAALAALVAALVLRERLVARRTRAIPV